MSSVSWPKSRTIHTNNPEKEVWNVIYSFTSEHFVSQFANDRVSKNFHGFQMSTITAKKQGYNAKFSNPREQIETLQPLQVSDISNITSEVANSATQAIDFYKASKELPLMSRPILLHYAFEKLMNILVLLTYRISSSGYSHGLTYFPKRPIEVKLNGSFQRFHDCYSIDPEIYLNKHAFTLDNIVDAGQLYEEELVDRIHQGTHNALGVSVANTGANVSLFELDREFLFIFAISTLARYRVNEWSDIVAGKTNSSILRIERYLQSVQMVFPNLIVNQLYGEDFMFFPYSRFS